MSWQTISTAERVAAIREVYPLTVGSLRAVAAGLSLKFNEEITRNCVAGMYDRHGDRLRSCQLTGVQPGIPRQRKPRSVKVPKAIVVTAPVPATEPVHAAPALIGSVVRPEPLLKTLVDLNHNECRWPVDGELAETRFCCHAVHELSAYCEYHRLASKGPGTKSERLSARELRRAA